MKRLVSLALVLVLAASLVACGSKAAYKDGTYTADAAEFHNGWKDHVEVTISGGKITSVVYNPVGEDGGDKIAASKAGNYVMTEDGPLWHEQSEAFGKYVVDNQGVDKLVLNDDGKTDAISSVSISLNGAAELVKKCLEQAK
ncbi:MAG: FMN-binding protein [Lachnospiraceae bacterium]|jgi:major membrane immunogen (membrane-anchored lipoprotein)|nr:FMN-binding protein [Lachnospiraceae bacterium]